MTPHELNLAIQAYNERTRSQSEEGLVLAYLTAYWQRVKRMPNLKRLLKDFEPQEKKEQTPEQMLAYAKKINEALNQKSGQ